VGNVYRPGCLFDLSSKTLEKLMTFVFIAPTKTGVLLAPSGYLPTILAPEDSSFQQLINGVRDKFQADLQLLVPVGRSNFSDNYIAVGEVFSQGLLKNGEPPNNTIALLTALVRGGLSDWRLDAKGPNDFGINFLGS
jgi:hypothetical protein